MFKLHKLRSLVKKKKRVGRGGDRGGTSGRGHKGQKARSGGAVRASFEGGQMPLTRRLPKRGFNNALFRKEYYVVGLSSLNELFQDGSKVTVQDLQEKGLVRRAKSRSALIKVLANGQLSKKLVIEADAFSKTAVQLIEKNGGQAVVRKEQ